MGVKIVLNKGSHLDVHQSLAFKNNIALLHSLKLYLQKAQYDGLRKP